MNKEKLDKIHDQWRIANDIFHEIKNINELVAKKPDVINDIALGSSNIRINDKWYTVKMPASMIDELGEIVMEKIKEYKEELQLEFSNIEIGEQNF